MRQVADRKWFLSRFQRMIMKVATINGKRVRYTLVNNMDISFPLGDRVKREVVHDS